MLKKTFSLGEVLSSSFQFVFSNFSKRLKDGFVIVFIVTVAFNLLNFLISKSIATNFTIVLFILFSMFLTSSIGISVHREILVKIKQPYLSELLTANCFKYFLTILTLTIIAVSPLIIHYLFKSSGNLKILNLDISYLFFLWIFSVIISLKFIFNLPKIALNKKTQFSITSMNECGNKLFVLFIVITLIFFIPSFIILSVQMSITVLTQGDCSALNSVCSATTDCCGSGVKSSTIPGRSVTSIALSANTNGPDTVEVCMNRDQNMQEFTDTAGQQGVYLFT